MFYCVSC